MYFVWGSKSYCVTRLYPYFSLGPNLHLDKKRRRRLWEDMEPSGPHVFCMGTPYIFPETGSRGAPTPIRNTCEDMEDTSGFPVTGTASS